MDDNQVYNGTGKDQIELNSVDDFILVTKKEMAEEIRKTWDDLWNSPKSIDLPKTDNDVEQWRKILRKYNQKRDKKDKEKNPISLIPEIDHILNSEESK